MIFIGESRLMKKIYQPVYNEGAGKKEITTRQILSCSLGKLVGGTPIVTFAYAQNLTACYSLQDQVYYMKKSLSSASTYTHSSMQKGKGLPLPLTPV